MAMEQVDFDVIVGEIVERLEIRYPTKPKEAVRSAVESAYAHFARARVRDFLPVLIEREAKARLERPI